MGCFELPIGIDPITGKKINASFKKWKNYFYRKKEMLIEKVVFDTIDFTICKVCGGSWSPVFNSEEEYQIHLRLDPHHIVWYFLNKMKWKKREK